MTDPTDHAIALLTGACDQLRDAVIEVIRIGEEQAKATGTPTASYHQALAPTIRIIGDQVHEWADALEASQPGRHLRSVD